MYDKTTNHKTVSHKTVSHKTTKLAMLAAAMLLVIVGVAARYQVEDRHPIFDGLEVGERIGINATAGGWEVRNYNGTKRLERVGEDYLVYSERGRQFAIHINQITIVEIR